MKGMRYYKYSQYDFSFLDKINPRTEQSSYDCSFQYLESVSTNINNDDWCNFSYLDEHWEPMDNI